MPRGAAAGWHLGGSERANRRPDRKKLIRFETGITETMAGKAEPRREGKRDAPSAAPKGLPLNGKLPLSRVAARLLSTM